MKRVDYPDRDLMTIGVANQIAGALNEAVMLRGAAALAVPGGSTPGPIFDALSAADLDWSKVTVLPGDERWVPETSEHSNAAQIKRRLLVGRAAAARFLPLYDGSEGAAASVAALTETLTQALAPHLPLTVALLGMGADMHTASLFPGQPALRPEARRAGDPVLQYVPVPGLAPKVARMTLSAPCLDAALSKHIVLFGDEKLLAFEEAQRLNDPYQAPIVSVLAGATVHWAA